MASSLVIACDSEDPVTGSDSDAATLPDVAETSITETSIAETQVTETSAPDTTPVVCQPLTLSGKLKANAVPGTFTLGGGADLGFGDARPDALVLEFYTNETGLFDLAAGENKSYATCDQCVRIVQDIDAEGAQPKHFFQKAGKVLIDEATPPEEGYLNVELQDLELVEVKIFADYHTEPVAGGACYKAEAPIVLETEPCVPACGDNVCGPDGCGGTCGSGCADGERCLLDGSGCEANPGCFPLTLRGGRLDNLSAGYYRLDTTSAKLGAPAQEDFLQLEFYSRLTGAFALDEPPNDNYATCRQCVRMVLDSRREFFHAAGSLVVGTGSDPLGDPEAEPPGGALSVTLVGLRLIESVLDEETWQMIPVPNGACIDVTLERPLERVLD
ncbi:MAG: hypothetical protein IT385_08370 [Deltaproteobacteria bacterium]|nr:hypothetical protein [Deltaproteobacteria bacterium]